MLGGRVPLAWAGQAEPPGHFSGLAARAHVELSEDRRDVMIDRLLGQHEPFGDLGVAQPLRDE